MHPAVQWKEKGYRMADLAIQQNSTLSTILPLQAQVAAALASGLSVTSAAEAAAVHRTTVYHWLKHDSDFRAALEQARTEYDHRLQDELRSLGQLALHFTSELSPRASRASSAWKACGRQK